MDLTPVEVRVLGCLMEKQVTTPDQYPLSPNAAKVACNQSTNRFPVVSFSDREVEAALLSLRERGLTRVVYSPSNRVPKHRHIADEVWKLDEAQYAVVTVLALRGAQTAGELKGRTERLHAFGSIEAVEATLRDLSGRDEALVVKLARRPGQKEERFHHLLAGAVDEEAIDAELTAHAASSTGGSSGTAARFEALETRVAELESVVDKLRALLD